jgi:xanthine/uracil permease
MTAWGTAFTGYVIALVLEMVGAALVIVEARQSGRRFRDIASRGRPEHPDGTLAQLALVVPAVMAALGDPRRRWAGVTLLLVGLVVGFAANVVSLYA